MCNSIYILYIYCKSKISLIQIYYPWIYLNLLLLSELNNNINKIISCDKCNKIFTSRQAKSLHNKKYCKVSNNELDKIKEETKQNNIRYLHPIPLFLQYENFLIFYLVLYLQMYLS